MLIKRIIGANVTYKAPNCLDLPVRRTIFDDGTMLCESAWELTPTEIETLKNGGSLVLAIYGGQPPVALAVTPAIEE